MEELKVLVDQQEAVISFRNFDEIKQALSKKMDEYKGVTFTEDFKQAAKGELASLRKLKTSIDTRRKDIKNSYMNPYNDFEVKVKELIALVDEPIELIDKQVKAFEQKQREGKRKEIRKAYVELIGGMSEYLPLDSIYDSKWENVSTTMKKVREDIAKHTDEAVTAVNTIKAMKSEKEEEALRIFKTTHSMAKAVELITNYENQKKEILAREEKRKAAEEERRRQAEIERAKAEERAAVEKEQKIREAAQREAEQRIRQEEATADQEEEPFFVTDEDGADELPFETPSTRTVFFKVVATDEEIDQVETALNSFGIYFERREI